MVTTATRRREAGEPAVSATVLDLAVPVHDEEASLAACVHRLHRYLRAGFPFPWAITIVDNGSTDGTWVIAEHLADTLPGVRALRVGQKGRGLALRAAWSNTDAHVVAYTDVDLSTGLDALLPLVGSIVSGHSDVAIGSRLVHGATVARGPKRELISRLYNRLLQTVFGSRVRDAQCGFKAMRTDVARRLLPAVHDDGWFFDTELLLLAEHNGLRILEVPVDWVDDPDSRVDVRRTVFDDLRGVLRMRHRFFVGRGAVDLGTTARRPPADDMGRQLVSSAGVGAACTAIVRQWTGRGKAGAATGAKS